jgi:uncharacterized protein (TIGR02302 family)
MNEDRKSPPAGAAPRFRVGLLGVLGLRRAPAHAAALLERKIARSCAALAVERIWPRLWLPVGVIGLFVLASLIGLWPLLPPIAHKLLLLAFGLLLVASLVPLARVPWPSRAEGLSRLERQSGVPHRPASAYEDRLDQSIDDPQSERLWATHRARVAKLIGRLGVKAPEPRVEPHDPFALRTALLLGLALAGVVTWASASDRLLAAFRFGAGESGPTIRLDAWVAPPQYTGKLPVMLASGSETIEADTQEARLIEMPEGTQLVVRAAGPGHLEFKVRLLDEKGAIVDLARAAGADPKVEVSEWRSVLDKPVTVRVLAGSSERHSWQLGVIDDTPPSIELTKPPTASPRGAMALSFRASDDYGILSAEASFALIDPRLKIEELKGPEGTIIGPLATAPVVALKLPRPGKERNKEARAPLDLASHPYAGLRIALVLSAKDHAGQVGTSRPHEMVMPARKFQKPLARAVVEQRRKLALQPARYREVIKALEALSIAPERYFDDLSVYLSLRSVYWRITYSPSEASMRSAVDQLWQIALLIEDGNLSDAERALKEAQDRLMQALADGASPEEIERLMKELRQALNTFLNALSAQAAQNPNNQGEGQRAERMLSQRDLDEMLRNIEEMAKSGATDEAQQMLSELRDLLDRLQAGRQAGQGQQGQQMMQMMEQFGKLITGQRRLMDDTFGTQQGRVPGSGKRGEGQRQQRTPGSGSQDGAGIEDREGGMDSLHTRQGELRQQLDDLMQQLQGLSEDAGRRLESARRAMDDAQGALGEEDLDGALRQQGRALEDLRESAKTMTEQMMEGGQGEARSQRSGGDRKRDPFDRPLPTDGPDPGTGLDGPIDPDSTARAKELLKELRRRLGDATRPAFELDYLERLLKRQQ